MVVIDNKFKIIAGIDEAGRGCLAGPVVAAAVILPKNHTIFGLADSKILSENKRIFLAKEIKAQAIAWAIGLSWQNEIDKINILQSTLRAMERAVSALIITPEHLQIDGNQKININISQESIIKGDTKIEVISAASILAKTFRDELMLQLAKLYPCYTFEKHKGYGTKKHLELIKIHGSSKLHRQTFRGVLQKKHEIFENNNLHLPI